MPTVTKKQVEIKWKGIKSHFFQYERNKRVIGKFRAKIKQPLEYDILCYLILPKYESEHFNGIDVSEFMKHNNNNKRKNKKTNKFLQNKIHEEQIDNCEENESEIVINDSFSNVVNKITNSIENNVKNLENKLNTVYSGQKEIIAALDKKTDLLRKFLENDEH